MKKIFLISVVCISLMSVWLVPINAKNESAGGPDPKVSICHREDSTGNFHLINVSSNAKAAHLAHGDGLPGGLVQGMDDKKFTASCEIVDRWTLVDTLTVPATQYTPTLSSIVLLNGVNYKIVATGTYINLPYNVSDAEYTSIDAWATNSNGYDIAPWFLGEGEFDLMMNGNFVDWGVYNPAHEYTQNLTGTGAKVSFMIFDGNSNTPVTQVPGWYGDNRGSLNVQIYSE